MTWRSDSPERRRDEAGSVPPGGARLATDVPAQPSGGVVPPSATSLGDDWVPGPDGVRERSAARVILMDDTGRVLVMRGHDVNQPERSWWFTIGGGIDAGETPVQAALRETREEVGIELAAGDLVGPVLTRTGIFDFFAETCRQHEVFYLARIPEAVEVTADGWTDAERELLDETAWLTAAELRGQPLEVFPPELPDVVDHLVAGWDGAVRHLGEQFDD